MKKKQNILFDILIIVLIIFLSGNSVLNTRFTIFTAGLIVFIFHIASNKGFDRSLIKFLAIWLIINILSLVFLGGGLIVFRIIIMTVNIIIFPYLLLRIMGPSFWDRLERFIFFLTVLSIPLYILNIIFLGFFNDLTSVFGPLTKTSLAANPNYWTALIYTNAFGDNSYGLPRNTGFMWEPGGFAMVIIIAVVYNWLTKGPSLNRRTLIYFAALITTFSTAGYFALLLLLAAFYIKKITFINVTLLTLATIVFYIYVYQLNFMEGKIERYTEAYQENQMNVKSGQTIIKVNRFQGGYEALIKTFKYPLGYGLVSEKDYTDEIGVYGTNGLGSLLVMWGIPAFIYLLYLMWNFFLVLNIRKVSRLTLLFLMMALLVVFFSNPIARYILTYLIILTPLALKRHEIDDYFLFYGKAK